MPAAASRIAQEAHTRNAGFAQPPARNRHIRVDDDVRMVMKIELAICRLSEERLLVTAEEAEGEIDRQTAEHEQD